MGWANRGLTGFGALLQQAREYKGASLRDVERATRIPRRHLSALENEEFHQLPPLIYARGIVRNYAHYLGLDPVETLNRFEQSHGQRSGGFRVVPAVKTVDVPSHWAPNFAIIAFMVVISAVIFAWMYSAYFAPPDSTTPTEQASQTPESDQEVAVIEDDESDDMPGLADGGGEALIQPDFDDDEQASEGDAEVEATQEDEASGSGEPVQESAPEDTSEPEDESAQEESAEPQVNTFTINTTESVWVQATVDGEIVLDDVVAPGQPMSFEGEQMSLQSGNAPLVNVSVNGEDRGALGDQWDATNQYP